MNLWKNRFCITVIVKLWLKEGERKVGLGYCDIFEGRNMTTSESHLQFRSQDDMGRHKYHKIKDETYCELICCHVLRLRNHHASPNLFTCIHVTNPLSIIVSFTAKLKVFLSFNYFQHSLICVVTYSTQGTLERNIIVSENYHN